MKKIAMLAFGLAAQAAFAQGPFPYDLVYQKDVTLQDDTVVKGGATLKKTWELYNRGTLNSEGTFLLRIDPTSPIVSKKLTPLANIKPGAKGETSVMITVPKKPGTYTATFKLADKNGKLLSAKKSPLYVRIKVE